MKPIWSYCFFCPWTIFLSIFGRNHSKSAHNKLQRHLTSSSKHTHALTHLLKQAPLTLPDPKLQCFHAVRLKTLHTSSKISAIKMTSMGKLMRVFPLISFCILRKWCNTVKSIPRTGNIAWLGYFTGCLLMCTSVKHFALLLYVGWFETLRDLAFLVGQMTKTDPPCSPAAGHSPSSVVSTFCLTHWSFTGPRFVQVRVDLLIHGCWSPNCVVKLINPWQAVKSIRFSIRIWFFLYCTMDPWYYLYYKHSICH